MTALAMTSDILIPNITKVNIRDSQDALIESVYRISSEILHHRWLHKQTWYFGAMTRQDATDLLMAEREGGVFLVRDSSSIVGDYVLCVKEDSKVSHYIINKIQQGDQIRYRIGLYLGDQIRYRIGDQMFTDLPALLNFYKLHYLDTTPLIRPAPKRVEKVLGKYDFEGSDPDDLPFKKGEILTVVSKDEEQWWTARNSLGQTGSIPVPYVTKVNENSVSSNGPVHTNPENTNKPRHTNIQRSLPAYARVKQSRVPNAYDKTALRLEVGDIVKVTKMSINGQWEGELNGKIGHFPFTHVEFIDSESGMDDGSN
ncbi:adapter molecule Crk isoform X2 [Eurytemora carolleeae]|uniref:adapter molecule Crk isoform X2 n=1 Tax=Eurytemora carolleeae TaxID=1294199 RepID=UPI000C78C7D1|nr:adapter molecule Crk isoform X2 [Eurytemora carolleeae]|eukprot:XP_023336784.1 adapter molecule Crk-like isoform X2 [Eurytemora affinis]